MGMSPKVQSDAKTELKDAKKHIPNALLASLNLLGPVGSVFATALGGFATTKRLNNIEHTLQVMGERLKSVNSLDIEDYMCSDEFIHLFLTVIQKAQIEHQEEKRRSYGLMLANMAVDSQTGYDEKNMFTCLLSEIQILHLRTLTYLKAKSENKEDDARWASLPEIKSGNPDLAENSDYVMVAVLQKLANSGLIKSKGKEKKLMRGINPVGLWFHSLFTITDLGQKFMGFLKT